MLARLTRHSLARHPTTRALFIMKIRAWSLIAKFILTLFVAKFMGFEDLGLYGLISAASIMFPVFTGLGLIYMLSRKAVTAELEEIVGMLRQYGRFIGLLYLVVVPVSLVAGIVMDKLALALLVTAVVALEHVNGDFYGLLLNRSKPLSANALHFLRTAAWIILFIPAAFFVPALRHLDVLLAFWLAGGVAALAGFFWAARAWPWAHGKEDAAPLGIWIRQNFRESRLLYLNACATSFSNYIDRYLITFFLGLELTGVYVFFITIISALSNLLQTGVIQIARPRMVRAYRDQDKSYLAIYRACLRDSFLISMAMALVMGGLGYGFFPYLGKPLIMEWFPILILLLGGFVAGSISSAQGSIFYSQNKDGLSLYMCIVTFLLTLVLNLILLPELKLWGAAVAFFVTACFQIIMKIYFSRPLLKEYERILEEKDDQH